MFNQNALIYLRPAVTVQLNLNLAAAAQTQPNFTEEQRQDMSCIVYVARVSVTQGSICPFGEKPLNVRVVDLQWCGAQTIAEELFRPLPWRNEPLAAKTKIQA